MKQATLLIILMLTVITAVASEKRGMRVLEDGRETDGAGLTLPANGVGNVEIRSCTACPVVLLGLGTGTRFLIGQREVSLTELRGHLAANPTANVLVVSPISQKTVSRIVASPNANVR